MLNNQEAQGRYDPTKLAAILDDLDGLPEATLTGFGPATLRALRLDALDAPPPEELAGRVEVTLSFDDAVYEAAAAALDALVRDHGIEAHVRRL